MPPVIERSADDHQPAFRCRAGHRPNAEAATQLAVAANRVSMIARIHHRLNSYEGVQTHRIQEIP